MPQKLPEVGFDRQAIFFHLHKANKFLKNSHLTISKSVNTIDIPSLSLRIQTFWLSFSVGTSTCSRTVFFFFF